MNTNGMNTIVICHSKDVIFNTMMMLSFIIIFLLHITIVWLYSSRFLIWFCFFHLCTGSILFWTWTFRRNMWTRIGNQFYWKRKIIIIEHQLYIDLHSILLLWIWSNGSFVHVTWSMDHGTKHLFQPTDCYIGKWHMKMSVFNLRLSVKLDSFRHDTNTIALNKFTNKYKHIGSVRQQQ